MADQYLNSGALWKNDKKPEGSKQPDYRARIKLDEETLDAICEADGKISIAGWIREGQNGKFVSLLVSADDYEPAQSQPKPKPNEQNPSGSGFDDFDDDIPF